MKELIIKFLKKHKKSSKLASHHLSMLENIPAEYFEEMDTADREQMDMNKHYASKYIRGMFSDEDFARETLGKNWKKVQAGLVSNLWRKNLKNLET